MLYCLVVAGVMVCMYVLLTIFTPRFFPLITSLTPFTFFALSTLVEDVFSIPLPWWKKALINNYLFYKFTLKWIKN